MNRPVLDRHQFDLLLNSARLGSHVNVASALFRLSEDQVRQLMREIKKTPKGKLIVRKADYDDRSLATLILTFSPEFDPV